MARLSLWGSAERRLDLELTVTNLTNNVYQIAKESELTPIQFAPRRAAIGQLRWTF